MTLKLRLLRGREVVFEMPLSPMDWTKDELESEFKTVEESFQKFSKIFDALSHETRLKMMTRLMEEEDRTMSFAEFMRDLNLNPKTVWESSRKLREGGFLEKTSRGKYSCSEFGQTAFIMMSLALSRLIESLEETENR